MTEAKVILAFSAGVMPLLLLTPLFAMDSLGFLRCKGIDA